MWRIMRSAESALIAICNPAIGGRGGRYIFGFVLIGIDARISVEKNVQSKERKIYAIFLIKMAA